MKTILPILLIFTFTLALSQSKEKNHSMSTTVLQDKIKGGWAGQVIGVTFGGPTEFRFQGTMINDYQPIPWYDGYIKHTMLNEPGLYDDLYMDLTFVDVFEKEGLDAPLSSHAKAMAHAGYVLWHANQSARNNILFGIEAPQSGHWLNNPHADDIDFQIESDFSGLMAPGMPNVAAKIGDGIGHIMNYGDGWYGGVYVGAMYSLAFVSTDINQIVREALKTIPAQSTFHQCISDVIQGHKKNPNDWKQNWFEIQRKWSSDVGCPDGVFHAFNIDAKLNAAYIVLGLLYGQGDFTKTLEIATRAGQDSDCNPSSAGGILGTMIGYDKIPAHWKMGLKEAENLDFKYTTMSLSDVYAMSYKHALKTIEQQGGSTLGGKVTIPIQPIVPVRFEQSFSGHFPIEKRSFHNQELKSEFRFEFEGNGFVVRGEAKPRNRSAWDYHGSLEFSMEINLDGTVIEKVLLPVDYTKRRNDLCWKYQLPQGKHTVTLTLRNPDEGHILELQDVLIYADKPSAKTY